MGERMNGLLDTLRSGAWLTRERVRLVAAAVLAASAIGVLYFVLTANGRIDASGRPLGTDFSNVYAAGTAVLEGRRSSHSIRRSNMRASKRFLARRRRSTAGITRRSSSSSPQRLRCCPTCRRSLSGS
jgi:hypothetical protein